MPVILFLLSIGLQLTAAVVSLMLVRTTGRKLAWVLISFALLLMAWRRIVSFISLFNSGKAMTFEFPEYIALIISILMLMGVLRIGAYFRSIRIAEVERKLAREKLRESEEKFKSVFDNAIDGILIADVETNEFILGNKMISRMLGYQETWCSGHTSRERLALCNRAVRKTGQEGDPDGKRYPGQKKR